MRSRPAASSVSRSRDIAFLTGALFLCLAVGFALPGRLESLSTTTRTLLPVALLVILFVGWLAVVRPVTAFALAFALLGIVRIEPAPVDAVFALLIAASVVTGHVRARVPPFVAIPLAGLAVLTILSMTNAVGLSRALQFELITLYMFALAVWCTSAFGQPRLVECAFRIYVIVAAACGAIGAIALYTPLPSRHLFLYGDARAEGLFKDPNVYSAFLVPAAVILLEELTTPRILRWRRSVIVGVFVLVSIGVVVAYSRAAWLNYFLAVTTVVCVQAIRRGGLRAAFRSIVVLLVGAGAGLTVLYLTGSLGFLQQRSRLESYDTQRFASQSRAFSDMTKHVFGYGPGQTELRLPISTHSSFARMAFEQGLLGVVLYAVIVSGTLLCALAIALRRADVNGIGTAALLGIWIGQVANGFFIDTIHWRHLWIFASLIWCGYTVSNRGSSIAAATR